MLHTTYSEKPDMAKNNIPRSYSSSRFWFYLHLMSMKQRLSQKSGNKKNKKLEVSVMSPQLCHQQYLFPLLGMYTSFLGLL